MRFSGVGVSLVSSVLLLSACQKTMDSNTVSSSTSAGKVLQGMVISSRAVIIKDSEQLSDNVGGGLAGGLAGGVAGSAVGKGVGNDAAVVGGALAGAVIGALIEDQFSTQPGYEYIVKLDNGPMPTETTTRSRSQIKVDGLMQTPGVSKSVQDEVMAAAVMREQGSSVLSVIQADAAPIASGTKVYVIYRDDRPRITPAF